MTWFVLAATAFVVFVTAAPALFRALGLGPLLMPGSSNAPSEGPAPAYHPMPTDKRPNVDVDEGDEGDEPVEPVGPRRRKAALPDELLDPPASNTPSDDAPKAPMRPAIVRRKTTLHLAASADTQPTGEVEAGASVFVLRENGDWALVLQSGDDGVVMGWAEKARLTIRQTP